MDIIKTRAVDLNTMIISYRDLTSIPIGGTSALLPIELKCPGRVQRAQGYLSRDVELDSTAYSIQLIGIAADCQSDNWSLKILTVNDASKVDTINECLSYTEIDKSFSDFNFQHMYIDNTDDPVQPLLYAQVINDGTAISQTGNIHIKLYYRPVYQI